MFKSYLYNDNTKKVSLVKSDTAKKPGDDFKRATGQRKEDFKIHVWDIPKMWRPNVL